MQSDLVWSHSTQQGPELPYAVQYAQPEVLGGGEFHVVKTQKTRTEGTRALVDTARILKIFVSNLQNPTVHKGLEPKDSPSPFCLHEGLVSRDTCLRRTAGAFN